MVPVPVSGPRQLAWVDLLRELVGQVEKGSVYDRHLPTIAAAVDDVVRALHRRGRAAQRWPQG